MKFFLFISFHKTNLRSKILSKNIKKKIFVNLIRVNKYKCGYKNPIVKFDNKNI